MVSKVVTGLIDGGRKMTDFFEQKYRIEIGWLLLPLGRKEYIWICDNTIIGLCDLEVLVHSSEKVNSVGSEWLLETCVFVYIEDFSKRLRGW